MIMSDFKIYKLVGSLPAQLEPNAVYAVRTGLGFDFYISDSTGSIAHKVNDAASEGGIIIDYVTDQASFDSAVSNGPHHLIVRLPGA